MAWQCFSNFLMVSTCNCFTSLPVTGAFQHHLTYNYVKLYESLDFVILSLLQLCFCYCCMFKTIMYVFIMYVFPFLCFTLYIIKILFQCDQNFNSGCHFANLVTNYSRTGIRRPQTSLGSTALE